MDPNQIASIAFGRSEKSDEPRIGLGVLGLVALPPLEDRGSDLISSLFISSSSPTRRQGERKRVEDRRERERDEDRERAVADDVVGVVR